MSLIPAWGPWMPQGALTPLLRPHVSSSTWRARKSVFKVPLDCVPPGWSQLASFLLHTGQLWSLRLFTAMKFIEFKILWHGSNPSAQSDDIKRSTHATSFCCRGKFKSYKSHLAPLATSPSTSMSSYVPVLVWTDNLRDDLTRVRTCCGSRAHKSPTGAPTSGLGACASRPATVHALHLGSAHGCGAGTRTSRFSPSANLTDYNYALNNG